MSYGTVNATSQNTFSSYFSFSQGKLNQRATAKLKQTVNISSDTMVQMAQRRLSNPAPVRQTYDNHGTYSKGTPAGMFLSVSA